MQDLRLAVRALRATPIVSIVAILSLALGIGANTAIFSLVNSLILRTLPVAGPERLALVSVSANTTYRPPFSRATFEEIRRHAQGFARALAYTNRGKGPVTIAGEQLSVDSFFVSGDFFDTLGLSPLVGRLFTPADEAPSGGPNGPVAVISYRLWQERFGGAASVIGSSVTLGRALVTIVGVTPPEFLGVEVGSTFDMILPLKASQRMLSFDDDVP